MKMTTANILNSIFDSKKAKNRKYSLRSMARQIGISHASLLRVLKGTQALRLENAKKIAIRLKLKGSDLERFLTCVRLESEIDPHLRNLLEDHLGHLGEEKKNTRRVSLGQLPAPYLLSIKIMEAFYLSERNMGLSFNEIKGLTHAQTKELKPILQKLVSNGLLVHLSKTGEFKRTSFDWEISPDVDPKSIQVFSRDVLRAIHSGVENFSSNERYSAVHLFSIPKQRFIEFSRLSDRYLRDLKRICNYDKTDQIMLVALYGLPYMQTQSKK